MKELPQYQCKKMVGAAKIIGITRGLNDGMTELVLDVADPSCPTQGHLKACRTQARWLLDRYRITKSIPE